MKKLFSVLLIVIVLVGVFSGCGSQSSNNAPAPKSSAAEAPKESKPAEPAKTDKPYAGISVNVACLDTPNYRKMEPYMADILAKTGIKATIDFIPESAYFTKIQVAMTSGTGEYDVIYGNNKTFGQLFSSGWVQELDSYINDRALTDPAKWDYKDFVPKLAQSVQNNGKVMGVPFGSESNILYYNKRMFKEAGVAPPKDMKEVMEAAKLLNKPEKGQNGIALIGTREGNINGYSWIMLWKSLGGMWKPQGKDPYAVLANDEAIKATEMWTELLTKYAPKGIGNYGWNELFLSMQQEKVAMIIATTKDYPVLTDPKVSKVTNDLGFVCLKGIGDNYTVGNMGAWFLTKSSKNAKAGWEVLKYLSGKDMMLQMAEKKESVQQTRASVLDSDVFAKNFNAEWAAATKEAYAHGDVEYTPLIPQGTQIREYLAIALSKALSGQASPKDAMIEANENVKKLLAETKKP